DLVVDAPAHVVRPRFAPVGPPRVLLRARIDFAEDVDEAQVVEYACQPRAFLRQKAGILLVAAPVLQIDRLMGDVPVAAQDDFALFLPQLRKMRQELLEKAEFRRVPVEPAGTR